MMDLEEVKRLVEEAERIALAAKNRQELNQATVHFLGRKSELSGFLRSLKNLPLKERVEAGRVANGVRARLLEIFEKQTRHLTEIQSPIDVTLPGIKVSIGHQHLVSAAIKEISDIFLEIGFSRVRHPEVESDWYAF